MGPNDQDGRRLAVSKHTYHTCLKMNVSPSTRGRILGKSLRDLVMCPPSRISLTEYLICLGESTIKLPARSIQRADHLSVEPGFLLYLP